MNPFTLPWYILIPYLIGCIVVLLCAIFISCFIINLFLPSFEESVIVKENSIEEADKS